MSAATEIQLQAAQARLVEATEAVASALTRLCPTHAPVQHRDRKRPWCKACGRDALGYPVRFQP